MIVYPFRIGKKTDKNIGTKNVASIATFCTDFSYTLIDESLWYQSLINIKNYGIDGIKINLAWGDIELAQDKYFLNGQNNIHKLCKLCKNIGIFVIINFVPFACKNYKNHGLPSYLNNINIFNDFYKENNLIYFNRFINIVHNSLGNMYTIYGGPIIGVSIDLDDDFFVSNHEKSKAYQIILGAFNNNNIVLNFVWTNDLNNSTKINTNKIINVNGIEDNIKESNDFSLYNINLKSIVNKNQNVLELIILSINNGQGIFCLNDFFEMIYPYSNIYNDVKFSGLKYELKKLIRSISCFDEYYALSKESLLKTSNLNYKNEKDKKIMFCNEDNETSIIFTNLFFGNSLINYCNIQVVFRGIYNNREVWLCKESTLFKPQISIDNKVIDIVPMETTTVISNGKVIEIFCLSKYDKRNYLVVSHKQKPYFVLSDGELVNIENGFSLMCCGVNKDITIWPKPSVNIFKYPNKSFEGFDYVSFKTRLNFSKEALNIKETDNNQLKIEITNSIINELISIKNSYDNIALEIFSPSKAILIINGKEIAKLKENEPLILFLKQYTFEIINGEIILEVFGIKYKPIAYKYQFKTINYFFNN
ncbi:MAG: hypothetical protein GYA87_06615 [Christensenellaceae bacterium]|nr:hypothetical protein [Christensenellaceae bacterium]